MPGANTNESPSSKADKTAAENEAQAAAQKYIDEKFDSKMGEANREIRRVLKDDAGKRTLYKIAGGVVAGIGIGALGTWGISKFRNRNNGGNTAQ